MPVALLLADNSPVAREGLKTVLEHRHSFQVSRAPEVVVVSPPMSLCLVEPPAPHNEH